MRIHAGVAIACYVGWSIVVASPMADANSSAPAYVVCFDVGSITISDHGASQLEEAAARVRATDRRRSLLVEARTDAAEAQSHSVNLSADRGGAVKRRLVDLGISPDSIRVQPQAGLLVQRDGTDPQNRCTTVWVKFDP